MNKVQLQSGLIGKEAEWNSKLWEKPVWIHTPFYNEPRLPQLLLCGEKWSYISQKTVSGGRCRKKCLAFAAKHGKFINISRGFGLWVRKTYLSVNTEEINGQLAPLSLRTSEDQVHQKNHPECPESQPLLFCTTPLPVQWPRAQIVFCRNMYLPETPERIVV